MTAYTLLSIGNSFTQDPQRYLHEMAALRGVSLTCVNLVIGGCSLERHYRNMLSDEPRYGLEINGCPTGFSVPLSQALAANCYDFVTIQQASHFSFNPDTYYPYIDRLAEHVRRAQPKAKLTVQCTWGYEEGSDRLHSMGFETAEQMYLAVCRAYRTAAESVKADLLLPSGPAMHTLAGMGLPVHRDTFHADFGYGRYLLSLVWLGVLCGLDPKEDTFSRFDVPVTAQQAEAARTAAAAAVSFYLQNKAAGRPYAFFADPAEGQ